jgi:SAM-dependent methyltransferase
MIKINDFLIKDENEFFPTGEGDAYLLTLVDCLEQNILISPDSKLNLVATDDSSFLEDGIDCYAIKNGSPILYPKEISNKLDQMVSVINGPSTTLQQYFQISQIKQSGEINAPLNSIAARKHQYRFKNFCKDLSGIVLDIGSDKPTHSKQFLPQSCNYLGLDPYACDGEFRLIGLGEILPVKDSTFDAVLFNTSLDHILDYHTAIEEARRVLKPDGKIVIATYAWIDHATLLTDAVHFHHFREFEVFGVLEKHFEVECVSRYEDPKHAAHRYGLYVRAKLRATG